MKISKKIILISVLLFLILLFGVYSLIQRSKPKKSLEPIPFFSPGPTSSTFSPDATSAPVPKEMEQEKKAQESYAKDRQEFLSAKPWILKLPLKSGDYFISYDPENDTLLITLYYSSEQAKSQQTEQAKANALAAIKSAGIDSNQKMEFSEILFK